MAPLPAAGSYLLNTTATLTATPNPGYLFTGWTGDATGTTNPLSVLMDCRQDHHGATFTPDTNDTTATGDELSGDRGATAPTQPSRTRTATG